MNRIDDTFARLRNAGRKALVTFITAGCPSLAATQSLVLEMERRGADLIELGIPFSDPIAEGPVIQQANVRALAEGVTPGKIFDLVHCLRQKTQIPLVFLLYFNTILHYGLDRFFAECAAMGVDGVIIPDLPFEESGEIAEHTQKYGVYQISMVAPTSTPERMERICREAHGFLYCVSSLGVTGMRSTFHTDFQAMFDGLNGYTDIPKCIGFGISTPQQVSSLKDYCDGVIVGSAIVNRTLSAPNAEAAVQSVGEYTQSLRDAL